MYFTGSNASSFVYTVGNETVVLYEVIVKRYKQGVIVDMCAI